MGSFYKVMAAVTGLLVAVTGVVAAFGGLFGSDKSEPYSYTTIVLDSESAYRAFLSDHPSNGK